MQSVTEKELKIMSGDSHSELVLRFTPEMDFGYADSREVPKTSEAEKYEACIVIYFGPLPEEGTPDTISLAPLIST